MSNKRQAWKWGLWAEYICLWSLRIRGYRILEHRFKTKAGEIDLIAMKRNTLLFIEIKARPSYDAGLISISPKQKHRIQQTAKIFLSRMQKKDFNQIRFDVMVVVPWHFPYHLRDAWRI